MAKYRVRTKQFCALSQEQNFQSWLQSVSQDLYDDLMNHLAVSSGCRSNHTKMVEIQQGLEKRGLLTQMIAFLKKDYPTVVEQLVEAEQKASKPQQIVSKIVDTKVFTYYSPGLLTFPQKMILENDDPEKLLNEVKDFCIDKVGCDYIIIDNRAYIEYFKRKYYKESKEIPDQNREIHKFRLHNGLLPHEKIL